ncbi:MAG: hypothetical protein H0Z24_01490 [Thermosipho sp. (in: Bacteria)]|nr:hypothetical protein [Thermosipho sp. (in: thermotogales)]
MKKLLSLTLVVLTLVVFAGVPLFIGTVEKNGEKYFVYEISPEFSFGPVKLGIGFTTYATDVVYGTFYYGLPSTEPSTNIINAFMINTLELNLNSFTFRYGKTKPITFGLGFNVRNYLNPNTRAFDISINLEKFHTSVHIPYELQSFVPFSFVESDSVYMGEIGYKFGAYDLSISGVVDFDSSTTYTIDNGTPVKYAGSVSLTIPLGIVRLGVEGAIQSSPDFSTIGKGIFAGFYGTLGSIFDYVAGAFYSLDGYIPRYFDRKYTSLKYENQLPPLDGESGLGYIAGFEIYLEPYGNGSLYMLGEFNGEMPVLEGNINLFIPSISTFNGLILQASYYDSTPFVENRMFDSDTSARIKISYPLISGSFIAGIQYDWEVDTWLKSVFVGTYGEF